MSMDPKRLAELKHEASLMRVSMIPTSVLHVSQLIYELLGEAERLRGERDELLDQIARASETVSDLRMRAEACTPFVIGHLDAGRVADSAKCIGKRQAYSHGARLLALALGETGAPEGEQPPTAPEHEGECRVKLGPSRDGWVCSKGTLGCIGEQP